MSWNYRLIRDQKGYSIREVFYDEELVPCLTMVSPCELEAGSLKALKSEMKRMLKAFEDEVLDYGDFDEERYRRWKRSVGFEPGEAEAVDSLPPSDAPL
jgi:hypothetical protein